MKFSFQYFTTILLAATVLIFISGCKKEMQSVSVMLVHTAPDGPALDFYPGGVIHGESIDYLDNTGYVAIEKEEGEPWMAEVKITSTNQTAFSADNPDWVEDGHYSLWLYGEEPALSILMVEDNFTVPPTGRTQLRFFHFSPDAPQLDVGIEGSGNLFTGLEYIGNNLNTGGTAFQQLDAGTYNFEIKMPGTENIVLSQNNVQLQSGGVYTFYLRGFTGQTGANGLGISSVRNR
jgi:hypothetical protein